MQKQSRSNEKRRERLKAAKSVKTVSKGTWAKASQKVFPGEFKDRAGFWPMIQKWVKSSDLTGRNWIRTGSSGRNRSAWVCVCVCGFYLQTATQGELRWVIANWKLKKKKKIQTNRNVKSKLNCCKAGKWKKQKRQQKGAYLAAFTGESTEMVASSRLPAYLTQLIHDVTAVRWHALRTDHFWTGKLPECRRNRDEKGWSCWWRTRQSERWNEKRMMSMKMKNSTNQKRAIRLIYWLWRNEKMRLIWNVMRRERERGGNWREKQKKEKRKE